MIYVKPSPAATPLARDQLRPHVPEQPVRPGLTLSLMVAWVAAALVGLAATPALAQGAAARAQAPAGQHLPAISLRAGMHLIRAELAQTPEQRQIGLMHRRDLAANDGMLFVFEQPSRQCFWMKNTPTPLTAAFLDDSGRIVNLTDMQPFDEQGHCSAEPVRYVLEMQRGWFERRGFKAGMRLSGPPFSR